MTRASDFAFARPASNLAAQNGLTKRDLFAAMAMQGVLAGRQGPLSRYDAALIAKDAVATADALLEELKKREG